MNIIPSAFLHRLTNGVTDGGEVSSTEIVSSVAPAPTDATDASGEEDDECEI